MAWSCTLVGMTWGPRLIAYAIHSSTAQQGFVGGVDDGIGFKLSDIGTNERDARVESACGVGVRLRGRLKLVVLVKLAEGGNLGEWCCGHDGGFSRSS